MTELWKFAWQLRSFHDLTIWYLTIWNKWKYCILDKRQFDKGQTETGQIEKRVNWERANWERANWEGILKGHFERAFLNWHYRKGILMKDISDRAFWKGIPERAFPKGHFRKGILMKGIKRKVILREWHFRRAKGQRAWRALCIN